MTICLVIPSAQSQGGEQGRMARCIPSNLIDIQTPLRTPAENFARCYNYFSNLEFMRMFYCSVISRLLIYRQASFNPSGHPFISSLNSFKNNLLSCNFSRIFRCRINFYFPAHSNRFNLVFLVHLELIYFRNCIECLLCTTILITYLIQ